MPTIQGPLLWLTYTTVFFLAVIGFFLAKFLMNLSKLAQISQEILILAKYELEPTLREIRKSLENINTMAAGTANGLNNVKSKISDSTNGAKQLYKGFLSAILATINAIKK